MDNFLFHKLSNKEVEKIKTQSKKIMDDFFEQIKKVKEIEAEPKIIGDGQRKEKSPESLPMDKKIAFGNSKTKEGFFISEKKKW